MRVPTPPSAVREQDIVRELIGGVNLDVRCRENHEMRET